jgi:hypothetical protein
VIGKQDCNSKRDKKFKRKEVIIMPNWCSNSLIIKGNNDELRRFVELSKNGDIPLSFNKTVPMPQELEGTTAPQDKPNWYDWAVDNWGTKWDLDESTEITEMLEHDFVQYQFDTAWAPPELWLKTVSNIFPTLEFSLKYNELGMELHGTIYFKNGKRDEQKEKVIDEKVLGAIANHNK